MAAKTRAQVVADALIGPQVGDHVRWREETYRTFIITEIAHIVSLRHTVTGVDYHITRGEMCFLTVLPPKESS